MVGRLWIDADPSGLTRTGLDCDDDLAILMALALAGTSTDNSRREDDNRRGHRQLITRQQRHKLEGISICGGNAPLKHTAANARHLLRSVYVPPSSSKGSSSDDDDDDDDDDVVSRLGLLVAGLQSKPLPRGIGWRDMTVAWKSYRLLHRLSPDVESSDDAARAIIEASAAAVVDVDKKAINKEDDDDDKLTVLMLGPPSNLARAVELSSSSNDHDLSKQLHRVVLMGGELTGQKMDLNFMSDRAAARTVIEALDVPVTIVPIQTCGQVVVTEEWVRRFEDRCCPRAAACALLPKMRQQVRWMPRLVNKVVRKRFEGLSVGRGNASSNAFIAKRWRPSPNLDRGFIPWDVVALLATVRPDMFDEWEWHKASLPSCDDAGGSANAAAEKSPQRGEPCDGTMTIGPGQKVEPETYKGWVRIPHLVRNETELLERAFMNLACSIDGRLDGEQHVPLLGGFLVTGLVVFGVLFAFFLGVAYSFLSSWLKESWGTSSIKRKKRKLH